MKSKRKIQPFSVGLKASIGRGRALSLSQVRQNLGTMESRSATTWKTTMRAKTRDEKSARLGRSFRGWMWIAPPNEAKKAHGDHRECLRCLSRAQQVTFSRMEEWRRTLWAIPPARLGGLIGPISRTDEGHPSYDSSVSMVAHSNAQKGEGAL